MIDGVTKFGKKIMIAGASQLFLRLKAYRDMYGDNTYELWIADALHKKFRVQEALAAARIALSVYFCKETLVASGGNKHFTVIFGEDGGAVYTRYYPSAGYKSKYGEKAFRRFAGRFGDSWRAGEYILAELIVDGAFEKIDAEVAEYDLESVIALLPQPIAEEICEYLI